MKGGALAALVAVTAACVCAHARVQNWALGLGSQADGPLLFDAREAPGQPASAEGAQQMLQQAVAELTAVARQRTDRASAEHAAQACKHLGEGGLALKVGLVGKLCVFTLTAPMLLSLLVMILELTP